MDVYKGGGEMKTQSFCFVSSGAKMMRQCELWQREFAISLISIVAWLRCFSSSSTWNKSMKV
jgi:hypothetical protein